MAHDIYDEQGLSHEELKYKEHTKRGADFCKIELFRSAREEFKAALEYKPEDTLCLGKIRECNDHIKKDTRAVMILVPIVLAIIVAIALLA